MRFLNLPGAPILLDRVGGRTDPAAALRTICADAIDELLTDDINQLVIMAPGEQSADWSPSLDYPLERLTGGRATDAPALPLPLAVGRHLIGDRADGRKLIMRTVAAGQASTTPGPIDDGSGTDHDLVVAIADGSALGRPGGPDVVHPQADGYDQRVVEAWRSGDPAELAALDTDLGVAVMATGVPVWPRLAALAAGRTYASTISYADVPFGTFYLVAGWR